MAIALITGAKGFIGRYVAKKLNKSGCKVIGIGHGVWVEDEYSQYGLSAWINGDVSQANIEQLVSRVGVPDKIFHLAGGSSVSVSIELPEEDFKRSVDSTVKLLEWVRHNNPNATLIFTSSAAVYGNKYSTAIKESDITNPISPYGYHKRISEMLLESYAENYGLSTRILRLFSVYGPGLTKQLLWDLCNKLKKCPDKIILSGNGTEKRDWLHVDDAAEILFKVSEQDKKNNTIINGGMGIGITVREIAEALCKVFELDTVVEFTGECRPGDPENLIADITHLKNIDAQPKRDWQEGIVDYVKWYKSTSI